MTEKIRKKIAAAQISDRIIEDRIAEKDADDINQKYFREKPKSKRSAIKKTHKAALARRAISDKNAARFTEAQRFLDILRGSGKRNGIIEVKDDREN